MKSGCLITFLVLILLGVIGNFLDEPERERQIDSTNIESKSENKIGDESSFINSEEKTEKIGALDFKQALRHFYASKPSGIEGVVLNINKDHKADYVGDLKATLVRMSLGDDLSSYLKPKSIDFINSLESEGFDKVILDLDFKNKDHHSFVKNLGKETDVYGKFYISKIIERTKNGERWICFCPTSISLL
jgi:hypothetical protein